MASTAEKICRICNTDCADRPRVKDEFGRYTCKACLQQHEAQSAMKAGSRKAVSPKAIENDELDLRSAAMLEAKSAAAELPQEQSCPKCHGFLPSDQRLCTRCGFDRQRGANVTTRVEKFVETDKNADKRRAIRTANYMAWGMLVVCVGLAGASFINRESAIVCFYILFTILSSVGLTTKICQAIDGDWGWFFIGLFVGIGDGIWILSGWRDWLKIMLLGSLLGTLVSVISLIAHPSGAS